MIPTQPSNPAKLEMPNEERSFTPLSLLPLNLFQSTEDAQEQSTNQVKNDSEGCSKKKGNQIQDLLMLALSILDEDHKDEEASTITPGAVVETPQ